MMKKTFLNINKNKAFHTQQTLDTFPSYTLIFIQLFNFLNFSTHTLTHTIKHSANNTMRHTLLLLINNFVF
jgi:hypothetical protein